jgi:hypothetical protein
MKKIPNIIKDKNGIGMYHFPHTEEFYPSQFVSELFKLKKPQHQEWIIPKEIFNPLDEKKYKHREQHFSTLLKLNPKISYFKDYPDWGKYFVCCGMISKFNFNDIRYYVDVSFDQRPQPITYLQRKIEEHYKISFQYVMSMDSIQEIIKSEGLWKNTVST